MTEAHSAAGAAAAEPARLQPDEIPVRVKLCGNCNPFTDAGKILRIMRQAGGIRILFDGDTDGKVLLSINGCDRACTAGFAGSTGLVVNGWKFEGITYTNETALVRAVLDALYRHKRNGPVILKE